MNYGTFSKLFAPQKRPLLREICFYRVISNVISVTMGEKITKANLKGLHPGTMATSEVRLNQPITITFVHDLGT